MNTASHINAPPVPSWRMSYLRTANGLLLALAIIQMIVGCLALSFSLAATIASVVVLGSLLLIASAVEMAAAIAARNWKGFFLFLLVGILYTVAGFLCLVNPLAAAETLTLMLAAAFLVAGTFRIAVSAIEQFPSWGWVCFHGFVTTLLGFAIAAEWPWSGLWVIGTFVGIDLIVNGVTGAVLALSAGTAFKPTT
jgi:uncharacterized membrane protein HdeD (DUF308 family)